jgi:UDP-N-acetylmuramoyl-L-alanyl-D-glutamate--2,6-diaminopimelate ligase
MIAGVDIKALKGLTQDSRAVKSGYLFAAFPGTKTDGRSFIESAIASGASVILAPIGTTLPANANAKLVTDENPRRIFAKMAAAFYGRQPEIIAAVTGTNGKTSTAVFVSQLWEALGYKSASLGTLGLHGAGIERAGSMTTPGTTELHATLAELADAGIDHLAIEASSHGLDQYRLDGMNIKVAGFTNLTRDHLDYHADMNEYLAAKARLFTEVLDKNGTAVLNSDVPEFFHLKSLCADRQIKAISYGHKNADLKIISRTPTGAGQELVLEIFGKQHNLSLPLVGEFQAMNALCALGMTLAVNQDRLLDILTGLSKIKGAPGRLQYVPGHPKGAAVYVDYAHTPDALENVLHALRPHTKNKLVCLFGCGGDRDKGKRPVMGKISADLADVTIITDDNPRSEELAQIRSEILGGAKDAKEIPGRREAILTAVHSLTAGDVLVIAGKGHEQGQIFKAHTDPFDDVTEVKNSIHSLS